MSSTSDYLSGKATAKEHQDAAKWLTGEAGFKNDMADRSEYIDPSSLGLDVDALPERFRDMFNYIPALRLVDSRSRLQKLGDALGITNYLGTLKSQQERDIRDTYFQMLSTGSEEQYNSEIEKQRRLSQAGINTDLQGLGSASEASEFNEPEQSFQIPGAGFSDLAEFGHTFMSAIESTLGIMSGINALRSQGLDLVQKEMSISGSAYDVAKRIWEGLSPADIDAIFDSSDTLNLPVIGLSDESLRERGIRSRTAQNAVRKEFARLSDSYKGLQMLREGRRSYNESRNNDLFVRNQWYSAFSDSGVEQAMRDWNSFLHGVEKARYEAEQKQSEFDKNYYSANNGRNKGLYDAAKAGNDLSYEQARRGNVPHEYEALDAANTFRKECEKQKSILLRKLLSHNDPYSTMLATQLMGAPIDPFKPISSGINAVSGVAGFIK